MLSSIKIPACRMQVSSGICTDKKTAIANTGRLAAMLFFQYTNADEEVRKWNKVVKT